jgi:hypothetical protein
MVTQAEYTAAANAVVAIVQADMGYVPALLRSQITPDMITTFANQIAKAAVDAAAAARAQALQKN